MSEHPSAFRLEAHAVGEVDAAVAEHVHGCAECRGYVASLEAAQAPFLTSHPPGKLAALRSRRWWIAPLAVAAIAAVAALVLVPIEGPPAVRLKGGTSLAVVRDRGGEQIRATDAVEVRAGDRLRFEVTLAEAAPLTLGVQEGDTWTPLVEARPLPAGTHLLEATVQVDDRPTHVQVLAGPADAVERARSSGDRAGVAVLRVDSP